MRRRGVRDGKIWSRDREHGGDATRYARGGGGVSKRESHRVSMSVDTIHFCSHLVYSLPFEACVRVKATTDRFLFVLFLFARKQSS